MVTENPDKIAALEKAIAKKYGDDAVQNPQAQWDEIKEEEYLEQMKQLYAKIKVNESFEEKIDINGIKVSKKLLNKGSDRTCAACFKFSFNLADDIYMSKYDCCQRCHIQWVEGREERWETGWRPSKEKK